MRESDWKTFLTEYNRELLSYEEVAEVLPPHHQQRTCDADTGAAVVTIAWCEQRNDWEFTPGVSIR